MADHESIIKVLHGLRESADKSGLRGHIIGAAREIPKAAEYLDLFKLCWELIGSIDNPADRDTAVIDFSREVPPTNVFLPLYAAVMEAAVVAADRLEERHRRTTELLRIAKALPVTKEFTALRAQAWRLAMHLPDKPRFAEMPLDRVARELPKSLDEKFYRGYTLLGIAREVPKEGVFMDIYREAIGVAIKSSALIKEPYYKKYALMYIANELLPHEGLKDLLKGAIEAAYNATVEMQDPFARQFGLLDLFREMPKTPEMFDIIWKVLEETLSFFTVRKWMEDVEVLDVVDFILSAEDTGINESKQKRFSRENYAAMLKKDIGKFGETLTDVRFIELFRPYTHVWVQPRDLRDAVKKVVERLDLLKSTYHGREIERPVFIAESYHAGKGAYIHRRETNVNECISIDLGATNTVIMRKKAGSPPDFVHLSPISRQYDRISIVPTVLGAETNTIGAEVTEERPIVSIKQMVLDGNPKGRDYMERFVKILCQHLRKVTSTSGWFSLVSKNSFDVVYVTVPVGFRHYRKALKDIVGKAIKNAKTDFIEEPLAAAIGYEVAGDADRIFMIIDFGGSTLNTMVVRVNLKEVHVVAKPERAQMLGGYDIDLWLAEHLAEKAGADPKDLPHRLVARAEEMKIELSKAREAVFEWDGRRVAAVSRAEFEEVLDKHGFYRLVDRTIAYVLKRAEKVGVRKERIEAVLLTGGSSQIPSFKEKIGDIFQHLRVKNAIYDHSPLTAVAVGAAMYGTKDVTDRHLGMAYAVRYATTGKETPHAYSIVLEKGEILPLEKTFTVAPARKLGAQQELYIEIFEVPEGMITRRWVMEANIESLRQEIEGQDKAAMNSMKTVTLSFDAPVTEAVPVVFCVDESGALSLKYGKENRAVETGLRLQ